MGDAKMRFEKSLTNRERNFPLKQNSFQFDSSFWFQYLLFMKEFNFSDRPGSHWVKLILSSQITLEVRDRPNLCLPKEASMHNSLLSRPRRGCCWQRPQCYWCLFSIFPRFWQKRSLRILVFPIGFFWIEDYCRLFLSRPSRHRGCCCCKKRGCFSASTEASIASLARRPPQRDIEREKG